MRHKAARATAPFITEAPHTPGPVHVPLGSPMNGGYAQHGRDQEVILQRTGLRPLRFTGTLIISADRSFDAGRTRIRLALYRSLLRDFVAAWSCAVRSAADENVTWHGADRFACLPAAIAAFEAAEPDFPCEALPAGAGMSATLKHAADSLARDLAIRAAFGCAVGMFLYELCMAGETSFDND